MREENIKFKGEWVHRQRCVTVQLLDRTKYKSGHAHLTGIYPEDCDNLQGADGADPLASDRIVADRGVERAPMLPHAEEDVDARSDYAGRRGI